MTADDCLFCKFATGAIPVEKLHDDDAVFAIRDIHPRAPTHVLVIPKEHIATARDVGAAQGALLGHMYEVANRVMQDLGQAEDGFRLTVNAGANGGQTVFHLHMHVLAGAPLGPEATP